MNQAEDSAFRHPRILILSQRKDKDLVAYSVPSEFEDLICEIDSADLFSIRRTKACSNYSQNPNDRINNPLLARLKAVFSAYRGAKKFALRTLTWSNRFVRNAVLDVDSIDIDQEYDLVYVIIRNITEVLDLSAVKNWRKKGKFAVCHFIEVWPKNLEDLEQIKSQYACFDRIYSNVFSGTKEIAAITGVPCEYLPLTTDALKFCPYPACPERWIDATYIGRRSKVTHQALLKESEQNSFFYLYDTCDRFVVRNHQEHRSLLANQLKRTRYFFANPSKHDTSYTKQVPYEFGWRYFEGAAAGTIMLGLSPETEMFKQYFNWPDAVIPIPLDAPNILEIMADLDRQPERLTKIRSDNVVNSLLRYDWVYVWEKVLRDAGLPVTSKMEQRKEQLRQLAEQVRADSKSTMKVA